MRPRIVRPAVKAQLDSERLPSSQTTKNDEPPELSRYQIQREIGRGAFGTVYRAWDSQLERPVALKVLRSGVTNDSDFSEARLIAGLDHPGIVTVFDCGTDQRGRGFIVTALLEGLSLSEWSRATMPDRKTVCRVFAKLCDAVAVAHQHGVVHRDLKPSNVIIGEDHEPCVLDFGLALSNWSPGREGELVGTPAYMSPEQARGEGHLVDARSDLFAVGILLFETLTGKRPWQSGSAREMIREIAHGSVRSIRRDDPEVPIEIDRICKKATAASMNDRYGSAKQFADDLRWFVDRSEPDHGDANPVKMIAARGLRPYTADDAQSFWTLLPGRRTARGMPECVAWWIHRLQDEESDVSQSVLVLYGPSGSGKSSLLHAGVLPFLDRRMVRVLQIDASEVFSPDGIAQRLARAAKLDFQGPLPDLMSRIRDQAPPRTIIAIDQFEQILAWDDPAHREQVVFALRQADGLGLQVILVIRDEFWSATSQLMRDLDSALRDERNAMGLERFSVAHAAHVLRTWSEQAPHRSVVDDSFVDRSVELLQDHDRVIPVRLALLASVLGDAPVGPSKGSK